MVFKVYVHCILCMLYEKKKLLPKFDVNFSYFALISLFVHLHMNVTLIAYHILLIFVFIIHGLLINNSMLL